MFAILHIPSGALYTVSGISRAPTLSVYKKEFYLLFFDFLRHPFTTEKTDMDRLNIIKPKLEKKLGLTYSDDEMPCISITETTSLETLHWIFSFIDWVKTLPEFNTITYSWENLIFSEFCVFDVSNDSL